MEARGVLFACLLVEQWNVIVVVLIVAVAARFSLYLLKVSSVKSGTSSSSHISSTCKQNGDLIFKWKRCLENLEYISIDSATMKIGIPILLQGGRWHYG
jgi:hypothetical protein